MPESSTGLRTLVLLPNLSPLSIFPNLYTVSAEEALVRSLNGSCDTVLSYDRKVLTASRDDLEWPSIIVNRNMKSFKNEVRLRKTTLYFRETARCYWCSKDLSINEVTFDHVIPRMNGGKHVWENVVCSCPECNSKKGHANPVGPWEPKKKIMKPTFFQLLEIRKKFSLRVYDKNWIPFLPGFASYEICGNAPMKEETPFVS